MIINPFPGPSPWDIIKDIFSEDEKEKEVVVRRDCDYSCDRRSEERERVKSSIKSLKSQLKDLFEIKYGATIFFEGRDIDVFDKGKLKTLKKEISKLDYELENLENALYYFKKESR